MKLRNPLLCLGLTTLLVLPASVMADGRAVYQKTCRLCHHTGVMGAPKLGNADHWKARIAKGKTKLYQSAIKGFKGMPPKGGNPSLSDSDIKAAVDYLVASVK